MASVRTRPLLPVGWRPIAVVVWLVAVALLVALSMHFANSTASNRVDAAVDRRVAGRLSEHARLLTVAVRLGSPAVVLGGSAVIAAVCLAGRWLRGVAFALLAAPAAGALAELVLKPAVNRTQNLDALTFPSGHTTGAFALALTVVVLLLPTESTRLLPAVGRLLVAVAALAGAAIVAIGVVVLGWHYATDAVGGAATALAVVIAVAAIVDVAARAVGGGRGDGQPSQAAAART